jgi:dephospho-CoA kinase
MLTIALTGNIGAGKSSVAALFRGWGATIIDADQTVRELQAPGEPILTAIVSRFGRKMLRPDGRLDRARLRARVMADPAEREALNQLIHPEVERVRQVRLAEARARGDRVVVCDIPLLFETHDPGRFDAVVLVDAPEAVRLARLLARPGLTESEARPMMAAQQPAEGKRRWRGGPRGLAPLVIENDADEATLERRAKEVWLAIEGLAD